TTSMPNQAATKIAVGLSSRTARVRRKSAVLRPRSRNARYATKFENPPTKKKIGMTWNSHVPIHRPDVTPIALCTPITPWSQKMMAMNQCPNTTPAMLAARRKSTYRSREAGVAAASSFRPPRARFRTVLTAVTLRPAGPGQQEVGSDPDEKAMAYPDLLGHGDPPRVRAGGGDRTRVPAVSWAPGSDGAVVRDPSGMVPGGRAGPAEVGPAARFRGWALHRRRSRPFHAVASRNEPRRSAASRSRRPPAGPAPRVQRGPLRVGAVAHGCAPPGNPSRCPQVGGGGSA